MLNRFRTYLWNIDPGYFHLRKAFKTIFAISVSLLIVYDSSFLTKLMAGVASGVSMQGVIAQTWRSRLLHVFFFNGLYIIVFLWGLLVRDSDAWTTVMLITLGFFVNYIRRFDLEKSAAPLMVWVFGLLAIILPFNDKAIVLPPLYGLFVGLVVTTVVILVVFPENYSRLFINNANLFFKTLGDALDEMHCNLLKQKSSQKADALFCESSKQALIKLASLNQSIQSSRIFSAREPQRGFILSHLYGLISAYSLLIDAYQGCWQNRDDLSPSTMRTISQFFEQSSTMFLAMHVQENYAVILDDFFINPPNLSEQMGEISPVIPGVVMLLCRFKLGFDLLNKHAVKLVRKADAP